MGMYLGDGRYLHCTGHERVFGCRVNSLRRGDEDFREDLAEALKVVGSVFREISGSGKRSYDTVRRFSDESYYGGLQLSEADERHAGPRVR